jgi:hypothetical protein
MKIKFTISDVLTSEVCWTLLYQPDQETPFATLFGGHHVWNWDFCTGNLLKDGIPLPPESGYGITIERLEGGDG